MKTYKDEDTIYFLMEFLGGGDLFTAIREIGMLTKCVLGCSVMDRFAICVS